VSGTSKATSARVVKRVDGSAALSSLLPTLVAPTSKLYSLCPSSAPASSSLLAAHRQSQADFSASLQAGSLERTSLVHCPESLLTRDGSAARLARVAQAAGEAMDVSAVPIAGNKGGSSSLQSNAFGAKKKATSAAAFFGGGGGVKKKEEKENKDKPAKASVFKSAKVPQKVSERVERAGREGKSGRAKRAGRAGERSGREERASEAGGKSGRAHQQPPSLARARRAKGARHQQLSSLALACARFARQRPPPRCLPPSPPTNTYFALASLVLASLVLASLALALA
jgi:hypothetical protein